MRGEDLANWNKRAGLSLESSMRKEMHGDSNVKGNGQNKTEQKNWFFPVMETKSHTRRPRGGGNLSIDSLTCTTSLHSTQTPIQPALTVHNHWLWLSFLSTASCRYAIWGFLRAARSDLIYLGLQRGFGNQPLLSISWASLGVWARSRGASHMFLYLWDEWPTPGLL